MGLGYVATLRRKDGRRQTDVDYYRLNNKTTGTNNQNLNVKDQENFSRSTRGQFGFTYTGNYGPLVSLPPQLNLTAALDHGNERGDRQNYSFNRSSTGTSASTNNYGITDHRAFGADVIEQTDDVGGQLDDVVGIDGVRLRRPAVAALIGCQHVVAGLGQRRNLVAPGVRQFGEAVGQDHHRRARVTRIDDPELHPIRLN